MPDLLFAVESAAAMPHAAAPTLVLKVRIQNRPPSEEIRGIALQCQIRIEPTRRTYSAQEQGRLVEIFAEPERWHQTLRSMFWTNASTTAPAFSDQAVLELPVPCTYDFSHGATKYFHGIEGGDVPLLLLFSGTIFYSGTGGDLQVTQVPWNREAFFRLPVPVWKDMMDHYYPNSVPLFVRRELFERLNSYKVRHAFPTWDDGLAKLLSRDEGN